MYPSLSLALYVYLHLYLYPYLSLSLPLALSLHPLRCMLRMRFSSILRQRAPLHETFWCVYVCLCACVCVCVCLRARALASTHPWIPATPSAQLPSVAPARLAPAVPRPGPRATACVGRSPSAPSRCVVARVLEPSVAKGRRGEAKGGEGRRREAAHTQSTLATSWRYISCHTRTYTTLDHSQKAENVCDSMRGNGFGAM